MENRFAFCLDLPQPTIAQLGPYNQPLALSPGLDYGMAAFPALDSREHGSRHRNRAITMQSVMAARTSGIVESI